MAGPCVLPATACALTAPELPLVTGRRGSTLCSGGHLLNRHCKVWRFEPNGGFGANNRPLIGQRGSSGR